MTPNINQGVVAMCRVDEFVQLDVKIISSSLHYGTK